MSDQTIPERMKLMKSPKILQKTCLHCRRIEERTTDLARELVGSRMNSVTLPEWSLQMSLKKVIGPRYSSMLSDVTSEGKVNRLGLLRWSTPPIHRRLGSQSSLRWRAPQYLLSRLQMQLWPLTSAKERGNNIVPLFTIHVAHHHHHHHQSSSIIINRQSSLITHHSSCVTRYSSLATRHSSFVIILIVLALRWPVPRRNWNLETWDGNNWLITDITNAGLVSLTRARIPKPPESSKNTAVCTVRSQYLEIEKPEKLKNCLKLCKCRCDSVWLCTFWGVWWCNPAWLSWTFGQGLCSSCQVWPIHSFQTWISHIQPIQHLFSNPCHSTPVCHHLTTRRVLYLCPHVNRIILHQFRVLSSMAKQTTSNDSSSFYLGTRSSMTSMMGVTEIDRMIA